jgi:small subunit ribosomal protein S21
MLEAWRPEYVMLSTIASPGLSLGTVWHECVTLEFNSEFHASGYGKGRGLPPSRGDNVEVSVRDNDVDQALRALKKKMQREGIFREMKMRRSYEKPSEKRAREKAEAVRRARKLERKRLEREGY